MLLLDVDKVFIFVRGLGSNYKNFKITRLAKLPYPSFNQFILAFHNHNKLSEMEVESSKHNFNQVFFSEHDRGEKRPQRLLQLKRKRFYSY